MKELLHLFKKIDGKEILRQYARTHVLFLSLLLTMLLGFSHKSLEIVRLAVSNRILCKMRKKYRRFIEQYKASQNRDFTHSHSHTIWVCWLQGMETAPDIVQCCYHSLITHMTDRKIILLTENNYHDYVHFPPYIQEKIDKNVISKTHMSDLLRLELLNRYGGTWIDATVFCSGVDIPEYMLDAELFLFQDLKPGLDGHCTCISSWLITASANHPILRLTLALLYEYWKENTKMIDYFLFHDFFQLAIEAYPEVWKQVIPFSNAIPHILLLRLFESYDEKVWTALNDMCCFHKLSYKFTENEEMRIGTYYDVLFRQGRGMS